MNAANTPISKIHIASVIIERARPEDAETICDIRDRAWLETYPNAALGITKEDILLNAKGPNGEFVPRRIAYLKEQSARSEEPDVCTFVARVDGRVVGYASTSIDQRRRGHIDAMYVAPEAQGWGVGGKLMDRAIRVVGLAAGIYLEVVSYNSKAIGFYEHYGFKKTDATVPGEVGRPDYLKTLPQIEMVLKAV